jgi:hypothetical protein
MMMCRGSLGIGLEGAMGVTDGMVTDAGGRIMTRRRPM